MIQTVFKYLNRKNCFSVRVINNWNNLPYQNSESLNTFKNRLDNNWHDNMYDCLQFYTMHTLMQDTQALPLHP